MRHGNGCFIWKNGDKYVGEFEYGQRTGNGRMTFANGDEYVGRFECGSMCDGFLTAADGSMKKI